MATDSEFEELIVLGIAASCYLHIHIDPLSFARQSRQKDANVFFVDIPAKLFSAQNFVKFGEYSKGKQDFSFSERQIEGLARLRLWQEQCADEDARIEDAAQLCALE